MHESGRLTPKRGASQNRYRKQQPGSKASGSCAASVSSLFTPQEACNLTESKSTSAVNSHHLAGLCCCYRCCLHSCPSFWVYPLSCLENKTCSRASDGFNRSQTWSSALSGIYRHGSRQHAKDLWRLWVALHIRSSSSSCQGIQRQLAERAAFVGGGHLQQRDAQLDGLRLT